MWSKGGSTIIPKFKDNDHDQYVHFIPLLKKYK